MPETIETLFEDADFIAVNKPSALLTEGGFSEPDLESLLSIRWGKKVFACHRLDRLTSGVVLLRKTARYRAEIAHTFEQRRIRKEYWALVDGVWDSRIQKIETRIARLEGGQWGNVEAGGKAACSTVQKLGQLDTPSMAWVRLLLKTGRTHQARLHCQWAGCPVLGDATHGAPKRNDGLFGLHARSLSLNHPGTKKPLEIVAEPPGNWTPFIARFESEATS